MLQILENGTWNEYDHLIPYSFNLKKNEDLDNAIITRLTKSDVIFDPLTKVKLIDGDLVTLWVITNCTSERITPNLYKQTIELSEAIEIAKGYPLENLTFTQPITKGATKKTLYDILDRLSILTQPLFIIDAEVNNKYNFRRTEAPEFFFTEYTLFDALVEIGMFMDMMPKVNGFLENVIKITFEELDLKEKNNYQVNKYLIEERQKPLSNYANKVVSQIENLSVSGLVVYPGKNMGVFVNAPEETSQITDSNAIITLPSKIEKVIKFEVLPSTEDEWFDETNNMVEYQTYQLGIPGTWDKIKAYYKYNDNKIYNLSQYWDRWPGGGDTPKPNLRRSLFRVTYIPMMTARISENNQSNIDYTTIYNQTGNIVNSDAYSENLRNYIKRMKFGDYIVTKRFKNYIDIPKIGHLVNNKYVITNASYTKYKDFYDVTLQLSEEYTRRAEFIRAKQEIRNWEIPADGKVIDRYVTHTESIRISLGKSIEAHQNTNLKNLIHIMPTIYGLEENGSFFVLNFITKTGTIISIIITATTGSFGNKKLYSFKALDNTLIGYNKSYQWDDLVKNQIGVTYTDSYGEFNRLTIGLVRYNHINPIDFARNYPTSEHNTNHNLLVNSWWRVENLQIMKDARETLGFTYQVDTIGVNGTNVHNNLLKNTQGDLYIYFLNKKQHRNNSISTDDIVGEILPSINSYTNRIDYDLSEATIPTNYQSIAIGLKTENDDKILIVQNDITTELKENIQNSKQLSLYLDY